MNLIPDCFKSEINNRIKALRKNMKSFNADALIVNANVNIYYLSGRFFRGYIFIPLHGDPIWFVIKPQIFDKSSDIFYIRKPESIPEILSLKYHTSYTHIGLEYDDLTYSDVLRLKQLFPSSEFINGSTIIRKTRMIKTDWEINQMKIDGIHQSKVYSKIKECYKPGYSDLQLQIEIEKNLRLEGSLGVSRIAGNLMEINLGSVISGENADNPSPYEFTMGGSGVDSSLPVGANGKEIMDGTTIMIDMNGTFNGYQTDMTRVWRRGDINELALKSHNCSIKILKFLEHFAVPGIAVSSLYEKALEFVREEGLTDYFMGHRSQVGFIGHGVGIELNEFPVINAKSKEILQENMTIAIEPKFVIPNIGAVGIENTYLVTKSGLVNLTVFPEEIQEI